MCLKTWVTIFKRWTHADHTFSVTLVEFAEDSYTFLAEKISALTQHHFICKAWPAYMTNVNLAMPIDNVVYLVDSA
jgi:hypothetical protein